jgi:phenylpropionate dioxygenase-like ring-hydroxylating dioxygenase large terminal subunit
MKSAYGKTVPGEDADLTHVEAGSPMGEVLRRYWQPVALSDELRDLPKRVRILCEDLVLFRAGNGKVGCLEPHCSHRGTSLEWGRVEENGLRCCYHGWLYDTQGRVVEMPCEPEGFCARMNVEHPAYPTQEYGGLVFVYMGPPGTEPLFPLYDIIDTRYRADVVLRGMRIWEDHSIGYVRDCNWLQHYENVVDPWHLLVLHQMISGDQFKSALMQGTTKIGFEKTSLGLRYRIIKDLPTGYRVVRYGECVLPNIFLVPNLHEPGTVPKRQDRCSELSWAVPIDNEHVAAFSIAAWPLENGAPKKDYRPGTDTVTEIRPGNLRSRPYEDRQRRPDDMEAQESQRPIAIHALETLGNSDLGIVQLRRMLREQIKRVQQGDDPLNVIRDEAANHRITTNAWNTILSPEEAAAHHGEEA